MLLLRNKYNYYYSLKFNSNRIVPTMHRLVFAYDHLKKMQNKQNLFTKIRKKKIVVGLSSLKLINPFYKKRLLTLRHNINLNKLRVIRDNIPLKSFINRRQSRF